MFIEVILYLLTKLINNFIKYLIDRVEELVEN